MSNYLVSFYKRDSTEPTHQVLVDAVSSSEVIKTAKKHFQDKNVPEDELDGRSVISYSGGTIEGIEVI